MLCGPLTEASGFFQHGRFLFHDFSLESSIYNHLGSMVLVYEC